MRSRATTGIGDLDKMLSGGIPEGDQVVLAGGPGAGKTLASFEFCYKNAKLGIPSLFFSIEEPPHEVTENAKDAFTEWKDIDELIEKKLLIVDGKEVTAGIKEGSNPSNPRDAFNLAVAQITSNIRNYNVGRVVIDSLSTIKLLVSDPLIYRILSINLVDILKSTGVTSMLTLEMESTGRDNIQFQPEFFIYDGIIFMYSMASEAERTSSIEVIKIRGSKHSFRTLPYEVTTSGINLLTIEGQDI